MQKQTTLASPGGLTLTAMRFISKNQNWVSTHASPDDTFKVARQFLGIFPEMPKHQACDHTSYHLHTLQYENDHRKFIHIKELP